MDFETSQALRHELRAIAEPVVDAAGCELVGVLLTGDRTGAILRLAIDKPGGVSVTDCTRVSRQLSLELDVEDPMPGTYRLEVSSPGMERPVERLEDFERFHGYRAVARMAPDYGRRRFKGRLAGVEDGHVLLKSSRTEHRLPLDRIDRVQLELSPEEFARLGDPMTDAHPDPGA